MIPDTSVVLLAEGVFILLVLYLIIRNLRMPASFHAKQREREELRRAYLKKQIIPSDENPSDSGN